VGVFHHKGGVAAFAVGIPWNAGAAMDPLRTAERPEPLAADGQSAEAAA
jgi:hypothetical protein